MFTITGHQARVDEVFIVKYDKVCNTNYWYSRNWFFMIREAAKLKIQQNLEISYVS